MKPADKSKKAFLAAIKAGEKQADQGKLIPLEQVEKNFQKWFSEPNAVIPGERTRHACCFRRPGEDL